MRCVLIDPGEDEEGQEVENQESTESQEIDYKTEYEKSASEAKQWQERFTRRDADYRAQHGQLAPTQKELARLKKLSASDAPKKAATTAQWLEYQRTFPEEAAAHELRYGEWEQRFGEIERQNTELRESLADRDRNNTVRERFNNVKAKHPDVMEIFDSKEFSDFGMTLPKAMRQAFENRDDPDDELHIHVLDLFKEKYANRKAGNAKADYVKTQGLSPRAKQTQSESTASNSVDPGERAYLEGLALAKKRKE